jgi:hypothetical protein
MTVDDLTVAIARWIATEDRCHDVARCLSRGNCACLGRGRRMAAALWPLVELHAREAAARAGGPREGTIVVESAEPGRRAWRIT